MATNHNKTSFKFMKKLPYLTTMIFVTGCYDNNLVSPPSSLQEMTCYKSFDEFAFTPLDSNDIGKTSRPLSPWTLESILPDEMDLADIQLIRQFPDHEELWFANEGKITNEEILIYDLSTSSRKMISDQIEGTNYFVRQLFITSNNEVWGRSSFSFDGQNPDQNSILSKFNDEKQRFEFVKNLAPITPTNYEQNLGTEIILDKHDVFWIAVPDDALYSYASQIGELNNHVILQGLSITSMSESIDEKIFLAQSDFVKTVGRNPEYSVFPGQLLEFDKQKNSLNEIPIPNAPWPVFANMFTSETGQLWLDSVGYIDQDEGWILVHPRPDQFFDHAGDIAWVSPSIVLESSGNILWFKKMGNLGTGWYDPLTNEGCMFTSQLTNVVEDSQNRVWIFVERELYSLSLN